MSNVMTEVRAARREYMRTTRGSFKTTIIFSERGFWDAERVPEIIPLLQDDENGVTYLNGYNIRIDHAQVEDFIIELSPT